MNVDDIFASYCQYFLFKQKVDILPEDIYIYIYYVYSLIRLTRQSHISTIVDVAGW